MKTSNNNIDLNTIDFYMQKSHQERSDAIFSAFRWIKRSIQYSMTILKSSKCVDCDDKIKMTKSDKIMQSH